MKKTFLLLFSVAFACTAGNAMPLANLSALPEKNEAHIAAAQDTTKKKVTTRSNVHIVNESKEKGNHVYINTDEGKRIEFTYKGKIALTEDSKDIKSISPGGSLKYVQTVNDFTRRIEMKSDANGTISRTYAVNGKETAYEPEGRQWLQEILPELMATTGIGLEERVKEVYGKSGAKGVLAEAEKVSSEHGKTRFVNLLLAQPDLKPADVKAALQFSAKHVNSDYERSKTLRKLSEANLANKDVITAYLTLTNAISSDYERGKALAHLVEKAEMSGDNLAKVVETVGRISSDYEKNKVLRKLVEHPKYLKDSYSGTLQVINSFSSDYEKSKAITNILNKHKLAPAQYQELLPVVSKISSDYEKGKVLRNIAHRIPSDATALRDDFNRVAKTINSDYEYRKVMSALN